MKHLLHILALSMTALVVRAQLTVDLAPDSVLIGERVELMLTWTGPTDGLVWPDADALGGYEVVGTPATDTTSDGLVRSYLLTRFDSGRHVLRDLRVIAGGDTVRGDTVQAVFGTIPVDTSAAFRDIAPVRHAPRTWQDYRPWVLGGLGVLLLIAIILGGLYALSKRQRSEEEEVLRPVDHHALALRRLDELARRKLWQNDRTKDHYLELSNILRTYVEGRFHVPALESTSEEIDRDLDVEPGLKDKLLDVLRLADLAKFAKHRPHADENQRALKRASDFVTHTKPRTETDDDA